MSLQLDRKSAPGFGWVLLALAIACSARSTADRTPQCLRCHGDASDQSRSGLASAAPPRSTVGAWDPSDRAVGAHLKHVVGGAVRAAVECRECHVVPDRVEGHYGDGATVTFGGALGRAGNAQPAYDPGATGGPRCSNVYCHGATLEGGTKTAPVWTTVDGSQTACDSCHGNPPPWHLTKFASSGVTNCHACHAGTVAADNATIDVAGGQHIDGVKQVGVPPPGSCRDAGCHDGSTAERTFPPADTIHATHASPPSAIDNVSYGDLRSGAGATAESYDFGCGECHPTVQTAHFVDAGAAGADVDLLPPATPVAGDDLKRRNAPDAAYDPATGKCSGVYCHSSGQEAPAYLTTPDWRNPPAGGMPCDGCHGNPPKYASGEAGSATANSHVFFDFYGWESGHFAGLPGPAHNSKHGGGDHVFAQAETPPAAGTFGPGQVASPMTCQTCHFDTVDGANVLAGRFFYFDTTSVNALDPALGDTMRFDQTVTVQDPRSNWDEWRGNQCGYCHDGTFAPRGAGKALPAKHVNGRRDVVFDARLAYAGTAAGIPTLPEGTTLHPYYMTDSTSSPPTATDVHPDVEIVQSSPLVLSMHLASATWEADTKTCSNVACHLLRQQGVLSGTATPLRWGSQEPYPSTSLFPLSCSRCHNK